MKIFGISGWSGSGKTTLLVELIPLIRAHGLTVSTIKHAHHEFDIDRPGKDSYRHREAGASEVVIASSHRWVIQHEYRNEGEWGLQDLISRMTPVDLLLVEGFKREKYPKMEVYRECVGKPLLHPNDPTIVAIASDGPIETDLPQLDMTDYDSIVSFILAHNGFKTNAVKSA